tara:strand:+ start:1712 stop:1981 length:270 start_codon:yes stop_codon:yes gene_type:complete
LQPNSNPLSVLRAIRYLHYVVNLELTSVDGLADLPTQLHDIAGLIEYYLGIYGRRQLIPPNLAHLAKKFIDFINYRVYGQHYLTELVFY